MKTPLHRFALAVLALALLGILMAWGFVMPFPTDPVGPRAVPLVALGLVGLGAVFLLRERGAPVPAQPAPPDQPDQRDQRDRPDRPDQRDRPDLPVSPLDRHAPAARSPMAALGTLAFVPILLAPLGFIVSVGLALWILGRLAGGRPLPSGVAALALTSGLFVLFVWVLGVPLPTGLVVRWLGMGG